MQHFLQELSRHAVRIVSAVCRVALIAAGATEMYAQPACLSAPASPQSIFQTALLPRLYDDITFEVDLTPQEVGTDTGVSVGQGRIGAFDHMLATIRFNDQGFIDMRDGEGYRADRQIRYSPGETYHVKMTLSTAKRTYSGFIRQLTSPTPEILIGENYSFRAGNGAAAVDMWALFADIGSAKACNGVAYATSRSPEPIWFNGVNTFAEFRSIPAYSVPTTGAITISVWIRPDALAFPKISESGYLNILGKGDKSGAAGNQEYVLRMYSAGNSENRGNRISFYVFNPEGNHGNGSYFQDPVRPGEWVHVVGVATMQQTFIYKNSVLRDCDKHQANVPGPCNAPFVEVEPRAGNAPLRIGTARFDNFFMGGIRDFRLYDRQLSEAEIRALYEGSDIREGLVADIPLREPAVLDGARGNHGTLFGAR